MTGTFYYRSGIIVCVLLGLVISLGDWSHGTGHHRLNSIGNFFGLVGFFFLFLSFLLSSRWKKFEDWIAGLDQIYHYHHELGLWGFYCILLHPFILASRWLPQFWGKFFLFVLPGHHRLFIDLGSIAFWLMILIIGVTIFKLLPYDKWKITHKFMSVVFILASLHILLSSAQFRPLLLIPLLIFMCLGYWGILYKQVFFSVFNKPKEFKVTHIKTLSDNVVEVSLESICEGLNFIPGQYGFFSFRGKGISQESHPFTLLGESGQKKIAILVKARGDFTKRLYQHINPGMVAYFEGPYGRFDYTKGGRSQIWIGGGIGIVPFITWASLFTSKDRQRNVDLFYCVHRKSDAIFLKEFQKLSEQIPQFRCFVFCSEENNRIDIQKILSKSSLKGKKILMCGPKRLTKSLTSEFQKLRVKRENILFEDFEFF